MLSEHDISLTERPITIRGELDLVKIAKTYQYAMVQHNPKAKVTRLESLVSVDDTAKILVCPRDDIKSYIILEGTTYTGWDCCNICIYCIDCHILGVTKQFILASKHV